MLIARENYACLHISRDHEGNAYDEYMLISGMLITRVDCIPYLRLTRSKYICLERVADGGVATLQPMLIGNTDAEFGSLNTNCTGSIQLPKGLTPEQLATVASALAFTCPAKEAARVRCVILCTVYVSVSTINCDLNLTSRLFYTELSTRSQSGDTATSTSTPPTTSTSVLPMVLNSLFYSARPLLWEPPRP